MRILYRCICLLPIMQILFSLSMSFMSDKYKQIVCTPSSAGYDDLIANLGEDVLPADYWGKTAALLI